MIESHHVLSFTISPCSARTTLCTSNSLSLCNSFCMASSVASSTTVSPSLNSLGTSSPSNRQYRLSKGPSSTSTQISRHMERSASLRMRRRRLSRLRSLSGVRRSWTSLLGEGRPKQTNSDNQKETGQETRGTAGRVGQKPEGQAVRGTRGGKLTRAA